MSGLIAILEQEKLSFDTEASTNTINPIGNMSVERWCSEGVFLAASHHLHTSIDAFRIHEQDDFVAMYAGDIVGVGSLNWEDVWKEVVSESGCFNTIKSLRGAFVFAIFEKATEVLWLVTDMFAWQPLYLISFGNGILCSTTLSTFHKYPAIEAEFNEEWLFEHLFFNYAVGNTTMHKGVQRVSAGTIIRFERKSGRLTQIKYAARPTPRSELMAGDEAIGHAKQVFSEVAPRYFCEDRPISFGLSAGLDCRSVLSAVPSQVLSQVNTFTYGIPGATEVLEVEGISKALGLPHTSIPLDDVLLQKLPRLMYEAVFLSDGLQNVNRSHLVQVYRSLMIDGRPPSAIVTGVSGDHLFRDHIQGWGNVPHLISADMSSVLRAGISAINYKRYSKIFGANAGAFVEHIERTLNELQNEYGEFPNPVSYLFYLIYEVGTRYFAGQAAIANTFSTFRTPFWDTDMIQLAVDVELSTLGFSRALRRKDRRREAVLQASIVAANDITKPSPYLGMPIRVFAGDNMLAYQSHRLARKASNFINRRKYVHFENWGLWYQTVLREEVNRLLGDRPLLSKYLSRKFISKIQSSGDVHWLGKLITAEIVLRLFREGWELDSDWIGT